MLSLAIISAIVTIYSGYTYPDMLAGRIEDRSIGQYILAVVVILLLLYLSRDAFGMLFSVVTIISLIYGYVGDMLPWIFYHAGFSITRLLEISVINVAGAYGELPVIGTTLVAPFLLFAGLIKGFGGFSVILRTADYIGKYLTTGVAQMAVVMSMLVGSISGSAAANTSISGSFTIPIMIENGIPKDKAAAVESVASSGGQILPPIMGVAAFVMADLLNIPLISIFMAAVIPAAVFYIIVAFGVRQAVISYLEISDAETIDNILESEDTANADSNKSDGNFVPTMPIALFGIQFILALVYLLYALGIQRQPVLIAGIRTSVILLFLNGIFLTVDRLVFSDNKYNLNKIAKEYYNSFKSGVSEGTRLTGEIMIIIAAIGIVINILISSGFPTTLSLVLTDIAGGSLFILLVITAVAGILLGLGMPTVAAYLIVAIILAPALVDFGLPELQVHFFVFYIAILSGITPPIAVTIIVATTIARSNFMTTCKETLKIAIPLFILPFLFIYHPNVITPNPSDAGDAIRSAITISIGLLAISYGLNARVIPLLERQNRIRLLGFKLLLIATGSLYLTVFSVDIV